MIQSLWTCNGCGAVATVSQASNPGWVTVAVSPHDKSRGAALGQLCEPCYGAMVNKFFNHEIPKVRVDG